MLYEKRPETFDAMQWVGDQESVSDLTAFLLDDTLLIHTSIIIGKSFTILTHPTGKKTVEVGDYIVKIRPGMCFVYSQEEFKASFR